MELFSVRVSQPFAVAPALRWRCASSLCPAPRHHVPHGESVRWAAVVCWGGKQWVRVRLKALAADLLPTLLYDIRPDLVGGMEQTHHHVSPVKS